MGSGEGELTGDLADRWPMERLILAGVATRQEIQEWYSIDDLLDANEALDAKLQAEKQQAEKARKARK